jgi:hypothetical protein
MRRPEQVLAHISAGMSDAEACRKVRVNNHTWRARIERDPELKRRRNGLRGKLERN